MFEWADPAFGGEVHLNTFGDDLVHDAKYFKCSRTLSHARCQLSAISYPAKISPANRLDVNRSICEILPFSPLLPSDPI